MVEMVEKNVLLCSLTTTAGFAALSIRTRCKFQNPENPKTRDSDFNEQSGLYSLSPMNDFIGNHIANFDNAFFERRTCRHNFDVFHLGSRSSDSDRDSPLRRIQKSIDFGDAAKGYGLNQQYLG